VVAREGAHEGVAGARGAVATGLPGIERGTDREDLHIRPIGPESVDSGLSRVWGMGDTPRSRIRASIVVIRMLGAWPRHAPGIVSCPDADHAPSGARVSETLAAPARSHRPHSLRCPPFPASALVRLAGTSHVPQVPPFPGAGRPVGSPPNASAGLRHRRHPTPATQLAQSCLRAETNVPCSVAGDGSSVPVPSATRLTVVDQSA
jgi:hypothetical protein